MFHVCETWLIWEPTMIVFYVVYGDVTDIAKPGRTKVVVYLPVSGPPRSPSLVLCQASENWCLGQCELLPSDCPGFQGILEGWSWWMYMRFISKIGKVQMCPTLYIIWFTLVSQYRIYVYLYEIYNVCIYIYYDATRYSYLIFMFLFPACHDILLFNMWHLKESKSSAS